MNDPSSHLRRFLVASTVLIAGMLPASGALSQAPPFAVGGDPSVNPADFEITVFASGLDSPLSMQRLSDGSLIVSTSGGIVRLVDADEDGVADGPASNIYSGGAGLATGLRVVGDLVFLARGESVDILRTGAASSDPLTLEASFDIEIPSPWSHISHSLAVREQAPGVIELYFNVGSKTDATATAEIVPLSGAITASVSADSIYRVIVDDTGASPTVGGLLQIASGVRNAFGMEFHPETGDFYFEDNSIDGATPPFRLGVDELNVIAAADVGGVVEDFGFPDNYFAYGTNVEVGSGGIDPILTFQPIPPPDGADSEGPVEIAFAPPQFPAGLNEGLFVGFHGAFSSAGVSNDANPLVHVDLQSPSHFHFIANTEAGVGHPDGLLATEDSLFVSDFTTVAGFTVPGAGRIYKIRSLAPQSVPALRGFGVLAIALAMLTTGWLAIRRAGSWPRPR
jgi:glucose/arabinose dehydrogenase